jgi:hypothetical protein
MHDFFYLPSMLKGISQFIIKEMNEISMKSQ